MARLSLKFADEFQGRDTGEEIGRRSRPEQRTGNQRERKTPGQRQVVARGGQLRSNEDSALGKPSIVLDFVLGCRCQVVDNSLQPGGVMLFGILHLVGNIVNVHPLMPGIKRQRSFPRAIAFGWNSAVRPSTRGPMGRLLGMRRCRVGQKIPPHPYMGDFRSRGVVDCYDIVVSSRRGALLGTLGRHHWSAAVAASPYIRSGGAGAPEPLILHARRRVWPRQDGTHLRQRLCLATG